MSKFKIGDTVVCIFSGTLPNSEPGAINPSLIEGRRYIIQGIHHCDICGRCTVDVGLASPPQSSGFGRCTCGTLHYNKGVHWASERRFSKVKEEKEACTEILHVSRVLDEQVEITLN